MPQRAAKYLHRKCRREACRKWSLFRLGDQRPTECTFCGAPFGKLEVGLDVQDANTRDPAEPVRIAPGQASAVRLDPVKPGDFEYVGPAREEDR